MRLLLSEPTTAFTPRVISSKLKGVRGLGGAEGIMRILHDLEALELVTFLDNHRAVRLHDDEPVVHLLKTFLAVCDLEGLKRLLMPLSTKGILFGSRARGRSRSDSDYDLFVVTDNPEEVRRIAAGHPLGKSLEVVAWTAEQYDDIGKLDVELEEKLSSGMLLWGSSW